MSFEPSHHLMYDIHPGERSEAPPREPTPLKITPPSALVQEQIELIRLEALAASSGAYRANRRADRALVIALISACAVFAQLAFAIGWR